MVQLQKLQIVLRGRPMPIKSSLTLPATLASGETDVMQIHLMPNLNRPGVTVVLHTLRVSAYLWSPIVRYLILLQHRCLWSLVPSAFQREKVVSSRTLRISPPPEGRTSYCTLHTVPCGYHHFSPCPNRHKSTFLASTPHIALAPNYRK